MTVTLRHLVGTKEPLDITIAALLNAKWVNPSGTSKPTIECISYIPSMDIEEDNQTDPNIIKTSVISRTRADDEPNGDDSHGWITTIEIDIWSESITLLQQYEDEVNRILWENRPNEVDRLKKSDGVEALLAQHASANSEIERFVDSEISFEFLGGDANGANGRVSSQGNLEVYWFKLKT